MIFQEYGKRKVACDTCGSLLVDDNGEDMEFDTWGEAKDGLDDAGWKTTMDGDWVHLCGKCRSI